MKKTWFFVVVLMLAGLFAVSCGNKEASEIKVGVVQAQTGMYAAFGQGGVFGIKAAVDDINKHRRRQGGRREDSHQACHRRQRERSEQGRVRLAESLIVQDKVNFIVSGDEPPPMHPGVSQAAEKHKVIYVTSTGPEEPWAAMSRRRPQSGSTPGRRASLPS